MSDELWPRMCLLCSICGLKDSVRAVTHWIQPNLVHDGDAGRLSLGVELHHGGRHVASRHDMLLVADG